MIKCRDYGRSLRTEEFMVYALRSGTGITEVRTGSSLFHGRSTTLTVTINWLKKKKKVDISFFNLKKKKSQWVKNCRGVRRRKRFFCYKMLFQESNQLSTSFPDVVTHVAFSRCRSCADRRRWEHEEARRGEGLAGHRRQAELHRPSTRPVWQGPERDTGDPSFLYSRLMTDAWINPEHQSLMPHNDRFQEEINSQSLWQWLHRKNKRQ